MKRIYLLVILFMAFAANSNAQCGLALTKSMADSIKYANPPKTYYIISYSFKNNSGKDWDTSYRMKLKRFYNTSEVTLNWKSIGNFAKDSTLSWRDTVGFTAVSNPNPFNCCDSLYMVDKNGATVVDTFLGNNKTCKSVKFVPDPAASVNTLAKDPSGLQLFPNPVSNLLNVSYNFGNATTVKAYVRDLTGRIVSEEDYSGKVFGEQTIVIDVHALSAGVYVLEMNTDGNKSMSKFTVSK